MLYGTDAPHVVHNSHTRMDYMNAFIVSDTCHHLCYSCDRQTVRNYMLSCLLTEGEEGLSDEEDEVCIDMWT